MSLADRLNDVIPSRQQCKTCCWLDGLPDKDRQAFDTLAAREDVSKSALHRMCREEGLDGSLSALKAHLADHHHVTG